MVILSHLGSYYQWRLREAVILFYKEVKRVRAHIETNESIVRIYDMPSGYYEEYKNRFQIFGFVGEKLVITAEDRSGDDITIYIYV